MQTFEKILQLIQIKGITISKLEDMLGLSNGTLRKSIEKKSESINKYVPRIIDIYPDAHNMFYGREININKSQEISDKEDLELQVRVLLSEVAVYKEVIRELKEKLHRPSEKKD